MVGVMASAAEGVCRIRQAQPDKDDTPPDVRVAQVAARQHGVVSMAQLHAAGLNREAIAVRARTGRLHRIHRGVYAVGHDALTLDGRFMAAVLAGGDEAVLSRWATAALAGLLRWDGRLVDVTTPYSAPRGRPGIHFHRARSLDARDTTRIRGIPTTTPARAILELAPQLTDGRLKRLVRQAQAERVATHRQFAETVRRANGHRATSRLAALIEHGPAPTRSTDEDVVLDLILNAGFERPQINQRLEGTPYYPDLRWPTVQLILEVDSAWHDGRLAHELDATRQATLEAAGERVLRTTNEQATTHPRQLAERLHAAGAPYTDPQS
jgi:very-short-patch-repair endonuclease/predicted transcriptional regulator of viral defense system